MRASSLSLDAWKKVRVIFLEDKDLLGDTIHDGKLSVRAS